MILHSAFDLLAVVTAAAVFYFLPLPQSSVGQPWRLHPTYVSFASLGMITGALVAGTGNLLLSGFSEIGKSVVGGLAGAILAIEILKRRLGITGSTGLRFAAPLAAAIAVGRLGCFFSGIEDRTYGTPTDLPWGHDFGDGASRHPVQLYEAIAMALFLAAFVPMLRRGYRIATSAGFYLFIGAYAAQRFLWEFIKPYGTIIGPFNLFHLICLGYSATPGATAGPSCAMARKARPYIFLGQTTSMCETCLRLVPAKIIEHEGAVWYQKRCADHGVQKTLISSDARYWKRCRDFLKPGDLPLQFQTRIDKGCPYDCGLCPDHEQHSCLALIEINETCNLTCPTCFAGSSPALPGQLPLAVVERMLDTLVASEGEPDLLQISGGEPTLHPELFAIIAAAKRRNIRHLMLNTNGIRIATEPDFAARLAECMPRFEVYLQFDALSRAALQTIRGADLRRTYAMALANLEKVGLSTTLVATVRKGINDGEIGDVLRHAAQWRCVRGVNFQPVQDTGRNEGFVPEKNRIVLSEIRRAILDQWGVFGEADMIPLPCNPEAISIGYGLRDGAAIRPVTHLFPQEMLVREAPNSVTFESHPEMRARLIELLSLSYAGQRSAGVLHEILCCLPLVELPAELGYDKVFRVTVVSFLDRFNFCLAGVKRSCIHFVTPGGRIIPFDTYNMLHRPQPGPAS